MSKSAIVATDIGGTSEFVIHEETGLLIRPRADDLSNALLRLVTDERLREAVIKKAYDKAIQENTEKHITHMYEEMYASILS